MKRFLLLLPLALLSAGCGSRPTPQAVVQQMQKAYAGLRSYQDQCVTTASSAENRTPATVMQERFAYQAPNRFFFGIHDGERVISLVVSDGTNVTSVSSSQPFAMRAAAPPKLAGSRDMMEKLHVPLMNGPLTFLVSGDPLEGKKSRLLDDQMLDNQQMRVVEVTGEETVRLWIGEKDHLLHRVERSVKRTHGTSTVTEDVVDTRQDLAVDQPVPPERFAFAVPRGYPVQTLVDLLDRPAPPVKLASLDGKAYDLASLKGKVVVLNFWAFW